MQNMIIVELESTVHPDTARAALLNRSLPLCCFLFSQDGELLYANQHAMKSYVTKHEDTFSLLSLFHYGISGTADTQYRKAMETVFADNKPYQHVQQQADCYIRLDMHRVNDPVTLKATALLSMTDVTDETSAQVILEGWKTKLQQQNRELVRDREELIEAISHNATRVDTQSAIEQVNSLMKDLLSGHFPSIQRITGVCQMLQNENLRQPPNLQQQLTTDTFLDKNATDSIMQLVGHLPAGSESGRAADHRPVPCILDKDEEFLTSFQTEKIAKFMVTWSFDAFELSDLPHPLASVMFFCIRNTGLLKRLQISAATLWMFLTIVDGRYADNPYHNLFHVTSVVHGVHMLMTFGGIDLDDITQLACYVAAGVHDLMHPGLNNEFLINTKDSLAITYNDTSPLENFHAASAFQIMCAPACNFISNLSSRDQRRFRNTVIDQVLTTDMKLHFDVQSRFNLLFCDPPRQMADSHIKVLTQLMLKCADLSHTTYPWMSHRVWCDRLQNEMFLQGDLESKNDIPVSVNNDRKSQRDVIKSQIGFFEVIVIPLYVSLTQAYPLASPYLSGAQSNLQKWKDSWTSHATCGS